MWMLLSSIGKWWCEYEYKLACVCAMRTNLTEVWCVSFKFHWILSAFYIVVEYYISDIVVLDQWPSQLRRAIDIVRVLRKQSRRASCRLSLEDDDEWRKFLTFSSLQKIGCMLPMCYLVRAEKSDRKAHSKLNMARKSVWFNFLFDSSFSLLLLRKSHNLWLHFCDWY